jgi:hypothetical protein
MVTIVTPKSLAVIEGVVLRGYIKRVGTRVVVPEGRRYHQRRGTIRSVAPEKERCHEMVGAIRGVVPEKGWCHEMVGAVRGVVPEMVLRTSSETKPRREWHPGEYARENMVARRAALSSETVPRRLGL